VAEIQALVALARRLEVGGDRVSIAHLEHRSHQGRADAPGLPLAPRAEQEQVVVGLVGVLFVQDLEDLEEGVRVPARDLAQRGAHLLVVFDPGWDPDCTRDDVVGPGPTGSRRAPNYWPVRGDRDRPSLRDSESLHRADRRGA
jgi:hypothetical protein